MNKPLSEYTFQELVDELDQRSSIGDKREKHKLAQLLLKRKEQAEIRRLAQRMQMS